MNWKKWTNLKKENDWESPIKSRGVFRTQASTYNGDFNLKQLS